MNLAIELGFELHDHANPRRPPGWVAVNSKPNHRRLCSNLCRLSLVQSEAASKELNAKLEEQQGSGKNLDASAQYDNTNKFYIYQVFFKDDAGVVS